MRTCTKCHESKPASEFSKRASAKDGLQSGCKVCCVAYLKAYRLANPEKIATSNKAYREANREKIATKDKAYYEANREKIAENQKDYYRANGDAARAKAKAYREANPKEVAEYRESYRLANPEKIASTKKAYRDANPEKIATYAKAYREANLEKIAARDKAYREANREEVVARQRAYQKANPEVGRVKSLKRRARKVENGIFAVTTKELKRLLSAPCAYCGSVSEHVDHIIPLARGGRHSIGNLTGACGPCNLSKGSKLITEWKGR